MRDDRVGYVAQIELELHQAESQIAVAVALVEHHLLGVDGPAFNVDARTKHFAHERRDAIGVFELDVMAGIGFVDREDLKHVPVVFLQECFDSLGSSPSRAG